MGGVGWAEKSFNNAKKRLHDGWQVAVPEKPGGDAAIPALGSFFPSPDACGVFFISVAARSNDSSDNSPQIPLVAVEMAAGRGFAAGVGPAQDAERGLRALPEPPGPDPALDFGREIRVEAARVARETRAGIQA